MALMAYLIVVTARTIPKIWNPYDILGISDVGATLKNHTGGLANTM
jgi:preprotein translocase subunit Sec63